MPSVALDGEPVPEDGALPGSALARLPDAPFGVYVHVPFCATRCGYCDFNTYTASELGGGSAPVGRHNYAHYVREEIRLARRVLGEDTPPIGTVFVGGGTPTLLPPHELGGILRTLTREFGLAADAEVTTEANPESVAADSLARLRAEGFTRVSFGMQSARPAVLRTLERQHTPERAQQCVAWAHQAGFEHVSLDLIYATPGESPADWRASLRAAVEAGPDHVSAYSLIVEQGTRLAARVHRGELPMPDDDTMADFYDIAEDELSRAGYQWYEVSNWARGARARCRHNMAYWTGGHWWGFGPGAHSHVGGTRWWNRKHPASYAERLAQGRSPAQAREVLTPAERRFEEIMLRLRLADGCPLDLLDGAARDRAHRAAAEGLLRADSLQDGTAVLTRRGRLLADALVRELT